jgi:hypothetical protein
MKNTKLLLTTFFSLIFFLLLSTNTFGQKKAKPGEKNKFLENKKYNVQFYELKATGRGKAVPTMLLIKSGKVEADLMYEKLTLPPIAYIVNLDSTYTEDGVEMHMVTFEANFSEDKNDYKWEATLINYDIEGTIVQMKSGVEKKKYEFSGSEKTKK